MRVGIDAWGLSGSLAFTGMGQYTSNVIRELARSATDVEVVAYGAPREGRPSWLPGGVAWRAPASVGGRWQAMLSRAFLLRRQAAADGIDVFHAPAVHTRPALPPVASVGCPLVVTLHDLIPLNLEGNDMPLRGRLYYRWNLARARRAAALLTVSNAARDELLAHDPSLAPRLAVAPNGVDFPPNEDPAVLARLGVRAPYVLYAGSYEPRKNLATALSAYARLASRGVEHGFVGIVDARSGHAPKRERQLASLRLGDRVRLVHSLADEEVRALYTQAAVLCFPSSAEGFGLPPLQAAACGLPVVASDLPSVREVLADAALYVAPRDAESLAGALRLVLGDETLRARLIEDGRRRAAGFTWARSAAEHLRAYRALVANGTPAAVAG